MNERESVKVGATEHVSPINDFTALNAKDKIVLEQIEILREIHTKICEISEKLDILLQK